MNALKKLRQVVRDTLHIGVLPIRNFILHPIWCYSVSEISEIIKRDWCANSARRINIGERKLLEVEKHGAGGLHTRFVVCRWLGQDDGWALEHEVPTCGDERRLDLSQLDIVYVHELPQREASRQNQRCLGIGHKVSGPVPRRPRMSDTPRTDNSVYPWLNSLRFWLLGGEHRLPDGGVNGQPPLWQRLAYKICKWLDDREARKCGRCFGHGQICLDIAGCTFAECPDCKGRGWLTRGQMDAIALVKAHPLPAKLWTPCPPNTTRYPTGLAPVIRKQKHTED